VRPVPYAVYVHGPGRYPVIKMFEAQAGYKVVPDPADAEIIVFIGGPDVEPRRYGEAPIPATHFVRDRDKYDLKVFNKFPNAIKVGICRGAQFLNVMSGGKMWQDVDHHTKPHFLFDIDSERKVFVTSTHHQMMRPGKESVLIAKAYQSHVREAEGLRIVGSQDPDPEVLWYPNTKSLCFQPHPEFKAASETRGYFFELLERYRDTA
jgi:gamma-glutamyl-gamma-aminobutyrate hydrolase PuuD